MIIVEKHKDDCTKIFGETPFCKGEMDEEEEEMRDTSNLIEKMLWFLDSSSDDDETLQNTIDLGELKDDIPSQLSSEASFTSVDELEDDNGSELSLLEREILAGSSTSESPAPSLEIKLPFWDEPEDPLSDPVWRMHNPIGVINDEADARRSIWCPRFENTHRQTDSTYVNEVNRAVYGGNRGHPISGSPEYFRAAQNYALFGKDFHDFPTNLEPLFDHYRERGDVFNVDSAPFPNAGQGTGLFPTPITEPPPGFSIHMRKPNFAAAAAANTSATYYQLCNNLQPSLKQGMNTHAAFSMLFGNKVTYVSAVAPPSPALYLNQHSSAATTILTNNLANNAALAASSSAILYTNPMVQATTQQYLNNFFKDAHLLQGIYGNLVYAQMLQQQLYQQTQQAAAFAAMIQQTQQRLVRTNPINVNCSQSSQSLAQSVTSTTTFSTATVSTTGIYSAMPSTSPSVIPASAPTAAPLPTNFGANVAPKLNTTAVVTSGIADAGLTNSIVATSALTNKSLQTNAEPKAVSTLGTKRLLHLNTDAVVDKAQLTKQTASIGVNTSNAVSEPTVPINIDNVSLGPTPGLTLCARQAARNSNVAEAQLKSRTLSILREAKQSGSSTSLPKNY